MISLRMRVINDTNDDNCLCKNFENLMQIGDDGDEGFMTDDIK